jgi:arylformamidase
MPIDYEVEYNNRARVPEHVDIFARWQREAADYRAKASAEEGCALGMSYGKSPRQIVDLFFPESSGTTPLALFVHGGYWRSLEPAMFSHMARGLNTHGVAVALAGYDLCPQVSINTIITQIRQACLFLWYRFSQRIMVFGHSAGGHLTACMVATDWKTLAIDAPPDLVPIGHSISGVFDLEPLIHVSMNQDLKLDATEAQRVSPLQWPVSQGRIFDAVVGGLESSEFLRQSQIIADTWRERGANTRYEPIAGTNHFTIVDALSDPKSAMVERLAALCQRTQNWA